MIARLWHGYTKPEGAPLYHEMLLTSILPGIHRIPGYKGSYVLRKEGKEQVEFITITFWESLDAIRKFAGEDYERCVIAPEAAHLLIRHDERSTHYESFKSD